MHRLYRSQLCITLALRVTIRKQVLFPGSLAFWYRAPWPDLHDDSFSKIRSWPRPSPPRFPRPTLMPPRRRARASSSRRNRRRKRRATCCKWRSSAPAAAARSISWPSSPIPMPKSPASSTSTRRSVNAGSGTWADCKGRRPSSLATSARPSKTNRSTPFPSRPPITGMPWPPSGQCRPARTFTWKSP